MIKKVTKEWLVKKDACKQSLDHVIKNQYIGLSPVCFLENLIINGRILDANWFIVRVMNKKQRIEYSIFAAEQVIDIYEKKYPKDKRPRLAIEAAKKYLKNPCKKTKDSSYAAAYAASEAASEAPYAASEVAYAASEVAYAASEAAWAASEVAYAASEAAYAAASEAAYAAASEAPYAVKKEMQLKILKNGIGILK